MGIKMCEIEYRGRKKVQAGRLRAGKTRYLSEEYERVYYSP